MHSMVSEAADPATPSCCKQATIFCESSTKQSDCDILDFLKAFDKLISTTQHPAVDNVLTQQPKTANGRRWCCFIVLYCKIRSITENRAQSTAPPLFINNVNSNTTSIIR